MRGSQDVPPTIVPAHSNHLAPRLSIEAVGGQGSLVLRAGRAVIPVIVRRPEAQLAGMTIEELDGISHVDNVMLRDDLPQEVAFQAREPVFDALS